MNILKVQGTKWKRVESIEAKMNILNVQERKWTKYKYRDHSSTWPIIKEANGPF